jgi:hypothetical protein
MSNIKSTTNSSLPDRLYGEHYPDSFIDMPKSILTSRYQLVDDNDKYVREERQQSDQPIFSSESSKPDESKFDHICPNNPILTCNCTDPKYCAELGSDPDGTSPTSTSEAERTRAEKGQPRREAERTGTEEERTRSQDGFSDNLEYTGIPIPTAKRKNAVSSWPCVVVGAVCETWTTAAEHVLRTTDGGRDTKQHIDSGRDYDGFIKANGF